ILTSCSGYEPFHKTVTGRVSVDIGTAVPDFLILDPRFPRAVRCCLRKCQQALRHISHPDGGGGPEGWGDHSSQLREEAGRMLGELTEWLEGASIHELIQAGLHEALTRVVDTIHEIGTAIHRAYFDVRLVPAPAATVAG